tara:strand:+ start:18 stop:140 length:123 start_codon:yes stop_codon:yes gene_type:complete
MGNRRRRVNPILFIKILIIAIIPFLVWFGMILMVTYGGRV